MRRTDKDNNIEQERKKKEMIDYMEQQANEIEEMQEELNDCRNRLEDHSKDTDLLKKNSMIRVTSMKPEILSKEVMRWINC